MKNNILNIRINNEEVVNKIDVSFKRKGVLYTKDIYAIMTKQMIENIANKNNTQYFMDVTYYATPPNNQNFKILIILAFDNTKYSTVLCNISLILNENKETFFSVLEYLNKRYKFEPKNITTDYSLAEIKAIKSLFPNINIIPCFFHFLQNICKKLPSLRSNNKKIKQLSRNLLANIKLLSFIPESKIKSFYSLIKKKYLANHNSFFKYFDKYYFNEKKFEINLWNYTKIINFLNKIMKLYP